MSCEHLTRGAVIAASPFGNVSRCLDCGEVVTASPGYPNRFDEAQKELDRRTAPHSAKCKCGMEILSFYKIPKGKLCVLCEALNITDKRFLYSVDVPRSAFGIVTEDPEEVMG